MSFPKIPPGPSTVSNLARDGLEAPRPWRVFARLENVAGTRYQEILNYGTAGRAIHAGFSHMVIRDRHRPQQLDPRQFGSQ